MQETLIFDQVHLGVPDPEAAARWYVEHLGAAPGDHVDRVWFGRARVIFLKNAAPEPSRGAAIDHFALSCRDVGAEVRRARRLGGQGHDTCQRHAGPGQVRVHRGSLGRAAFNSSKSPTRQAFHHVHLNVPEPEGTRAWYLDQVRR